MNQQYFYGSCTSANASPAELCCAPDLKLDIFILNIEKWKKQPQVFIFTFLVQVTEAEAGKTKY